MLHLYFLSVGPVLDPGILLSFQWLTIDSGGWLCMQWLQGWRLTPGAVVVRLTLVAVVKVAQWRSGCCSSKSSGWRLIDFGDWCCSIDSELLSLHAVAPGLTIDSSGSRSIDSSGCCAIDSSGWRSSGGSCGWRSIDSVAVVPVAPVAVVRSTPVAVVQSTPVAVQSTPPVCCSITPVAAVRSTPVAVVPVVVQVAVVRSTPVAVVLVAPVAVVLSVACRSGISSCRSQLWYLSLAALVSVANGSSIYGSSGSTSICRSISVAVAPLLLLLLLALLCLCGYW